MSEVPAGNTNAAPRVSIVGGGLAGLAAASALAMSGCRVELFESRRRLGGRAASFRDPETGELVDHCQHVALGCCTNLARFCRQTGIDDCFRRDEVLHFIGPRGERCHVRAARWLPAPLHLLPALVGLRYLSWSDRCRLARCVWRLARLRANDDPHGPTMRAWLQAQGQSDTAIEHFWTVILVSALGESLDRVSVSAARKVFMDGFLASSEASSLYVPNSPLELIYGQRLLHWLGEHDVEVHLSAAVEHIELGHRPRVVMAGGEAREFDYVVVAVPWRQAASLFDLESRSRLPTLELASRLQPAPISAVHLWFDRPIMDLPHAVLVGRLSQWIFNHGASHSGTSENRNASTVDKPTRGSHYYQVVISASHELCGRDREAVVAEVIGELATIWPEVATARLVRARLVTEPFSVFSVAPGTEQWRPAQRTHDPRLLLAGDWTATGWPATMEGAVRSGYLAAEAILEVEGHPRSLLSPDLPKGALLRWLLPYEDGAP